MHFLVLGIILVLLIFGPQLWARHTFKRYSEDKDIYPGTGAELAQHFINKYHIQGVSVELTESGDHYDPSSKTVRLSPQNYHGKSLTAIAVAAHEIGHAIQHAENNKMLTLRTKLVKSTIVAEQISSMAFVAMPIVTLITRAPSAGLLMFLIAIGSMLMSTLVHLVTLPVELDASFRKALPLLKNGNYIDDADLKGAEKVLRAAAWTYVAGSLTSLLNLARWIALLRR